MTKQTARIKIAPVTKGSLDELKTEENWSYGLVIDALIEEHDELNDPEIIREKEKKHKDKYVEKSEYSRLYEENIGNREKLKELTDEFEDKLEKTIGELRGNEEDYAAELKEQHDNYGKLQETLTLKTNEIEALTSENMDIQEKLDQLNNRLSGIQKEYDGCDRRYKNFKAYVDRQEYLITKGQLKTLFNIAVFLSHPLRKRRVFTLDNLTDELIYCGAGEIEDVIPLFSYNIFPVKKYLVDGVECFGFDRHYLKHLK